jgi:hypothetical protein
MRCRAAVGIALLVAASAACRRAETPPVETSGPCLTPESLYHRSTLALLARFRSELDAAQEAPRSQLSAVVDRLSRTRELASQLRPPACAGLFQRHVLEAMDAEIASVRRFRDLDEDGVRRWAAADRDERRKMLDRTHVEYAWKLVTFELEILEKRPNVLSPAPHPGRGRDAVEPGTGAAEGGQE